MNVLSLNQADVIHKIMKGDVSEFEGITEEQWVTYCLLVNQLTPYDYPSAIDVARERYDSVSLEFTLKEQELFRDKDLDEIVFKYPQRIDNRLVELCGAVDTIHKCLISSFSKELTESTILRIAKLCCVRYEVLTEYISKVKGESSILRFENAILDLRESARVSPAVLQRLWSIRNSVRVYQHYGRTSLPDFGSIEMLENRALSFNITMKELCSDVLRRFPYTRDWLALKGTITEFLVSNRVVVDNYFSAIYGGAYVEDIAYNKELYSLHRTTGRYEYLESVITELCPGVSVVISKAMQSPLVFPDYMWKNPGRFCAFMVHIAKTHGLCSGRTLLVLEELIENMPSDTDHILSCQEDVVLDSASVALMAELGISPSKRKLFFRDCVYSDYRSYVLRFLYDEKKAFMLWAREYLKWHDAVEFSSSNYYKT